MNQMKPAIADAVPAFENNVPKSRQYVVIVSPYAPNSVEAARKSDCLNTAKGPLGICNCIFQCKIILNDFE